jgi:ABC-2 type transport system permease protein
LYSSFLAEVLKLRKRPTVWVLGALWLVILLFFLYLLPALFFTITLADAPAEVASETSLQEQLPVLAPENLATYLLRFLFPGLGMTLALILGALVAGSEYSWGTIKIVLSQGPGRLAVLSGKLLALLSLIVIFVFVAFLGAGVSSLAVALFSGASLVRPPAMVLLGGLGAGALMLVVWAAFGFALATLFRNTALAVGLGLIYSFAVEPALLNLSTMNESLQSLVRFFPGTNTSALSFTFEDPALREGLLSPAQSILVVLVYTAVFILTAALVFWRRDVTA